MIFFSWGSEAGQFAYRRQDKASVRFTRTARPLSTFEQGQDHRGRWRQSARSGRQSGHI